MEIRTYHLELEDKSIRMGTQMHGRTQILLLDIVKFALTMEPVRAHATEIAKLYCGVAQLVRACSSLVRVQPPQPTS